MGRTVVVGIGEPSRGDDACGHRVVQALRPRLGHDVELVEAGGDPTALLDLWAGAELAVVVDAMQGGLAPGASVRLEVDGLRGLPRSRSTSSHGLSVPDVLELGRAVGKLPGRLVLYLIEAADVRAGERLSPEVAGAVERTARAIEDELRVRAGTPRGG